MDVEPHDRHVGVDQRVVQARSENLLRPFGPDLLRQHALVFIEGRARALALVERGVAGPAMTVAGDIALALLPGRRPLRLSAFDAACALAPVLTVRVCNSVLVVRRSMAEANVFGFEHVLELELT